MTTKGPEQITTPERMMTFTMEGKTKHDFSNPISLSKLRLFFKTVEIETFFTKSFYNKLNT